jgi:hypothetical protein
MCVCRSVGIVRSRTQTMELVIYICVCVNSFKKRMFCSLSYNNIISVTNAKTVDILGSYIDITVVDLRG